MLPKQARYQLRYTRLLSYSIRLVVFSQTTRATTRATPGSILLLRSRYLYDTLRSLPYRNTFRRKKAEAAVCKALLRIIGKGTNAPVYAPEPPALHPDTSGFCRRAYGNRFFRSDIPSQAKGHTYSYRAYRTVLLYRAAAEMSSLRFSEQGYPGVSGNGPPFVDAGVLSTGHPGASGDDRSGTGGAGSRPGHPGVMVYSAAAAHIDEGEHS